MAQKASGRHPINHELHIDTFAIIHEQLLIAKLPADGLSKNAFTLISSYLSNHCQRVKINTTFNSWKEL